MIIMIGTWLLFILSIITLLLVYENDKHEPADGLARVGSGIFGFAGVIFLIFILFNQVFPYGRYQEKVAERQTIIKHLESGEYHVTTLVNGDKGQKLVTINYIKKAYDFNAEMHTIKYYGNNVMTNWFYNREVVKNVDNLFIDIEVYVNNEPMKVDLKTKYALPYSGTYYDCPKCGETVRIYDNYCLDCGQKLDWSDDK